VAADADLLVRLVAPPQAELGLREAEPDAGGSPQTAGLVLQVTNPVTYPAPPQRGFSSPLAQGYLCRTGPRLRLSLQELRRFVQLLASRAEPFDASNYLDRLRDRHGALPYSFKKLATAAIVWPKRRTALIPSELAALMGCHPSLVLKAIQTGTLRARRRTPCRWEITRRAWADAFPLTINRQLRPPPLPTTDLVSTAAAAAHLRTCGMSDATPELVRALIREGKLAANPRPPHTRKLFILKTSLKAFRLRQIQDHD
jgi:hypothetical protein